MYPSHHTLYGPLHTKENAYLIGISYRKDMGLEIKSEFIRDEEEGNKENI